MTEQDQYLACAELDGIEVDRLGRWRHKDGSWNMWPLDYSTRDAVIGVIEKHLRTNGFNDEKTVAAFDCMFGSPVIWQDIICATPAQLREALLRAAGKWKE